MAEKARALMELAIPGRQPLPGSRNAALDRLEFRPAFRGTELQTAGPPAPRGSVKLRPRGPGPAEISLFSWRRSTIVR
jgi:hypothetical protein